MKVLCESCGALAEARLVARPGGAALVCESCGAETAVPAASPPAGPPPASLPPDEEAAWSELRSRWQDPEAHEAFLSRFADLEGLARAGAHYRDVLATSPSDEAAQKGRNEVLKRATALGLVAIPRTPAPADEPRALKWGALAVLASALLGAAGWVAWSFARLKAVR